MSFTEGTQLYKYALKERIGTGSFGEVWLAHDASIGRDVAVKIMSTDRAPAIEQLKEAQIGNRLDHPNLVKIFYADVVEVDAKPFVILAMEYFPRGSITSVVTAGNYLPLGFALHSLAGVLRGLENLHEHGYYHGDIKPQNILIGNNDQSVLGDYGIALDAPDGGEVNMRDSYIPHAAPEVFDRAKVSRQTDIYQTGLTAFRLINGLGNISNKFQQLGRDDFGDLVRAGGVISDADYLPFVPAAVRRIINKAVAVNPGDRYQTAIDMRRALEALHYPGKWEISAAGKYMGSNLGYRYTYSEVILPGARCTFSAFKLSILSGRQTKISKYCYKQLTKAQLLRLKKRFMQDVLIGNV